ncbi:hypothetical protein KHW15_19840 [Pseudomonas syringae]|uniref:hypothetical protein n=1 Tax=Pseudomonas syringae TaxID=317 RepID=UPI001BD1450C|nr:hypothetical protein [Pseudomonas syringae]QVI79230.1 hypothetical protein KHW15_19840 [Pseudomonas syringae]QVK31069.1 hypothetical protein KIJ28_18515 [Pseudomonas syringae]
MGIEFFGWRDGGYGPLDLTPKRSEILIILETPFMYVRLDQTSANLPNGAASLDKPPGQWQSGLLEGKRRPLA